MKGGGGAGGAHHGGAGADGDEDHLHDGAANGFGFVGDDDELEENQALVGRCTLCCTLTSLNLV